MGEIYRNADLFISTSHEAEGFGLPALEAMGCGIPAILSNISSYTSFDYPLDYALFIDPSDIKALGEGISRLYHDSSLRDQLASRGLSVAENFTKEKVVSRLENAFADILH
jgi:alpha-1,3-rhamnosyl/mannosyltransferase